MDSNQQARSSRQGSTLCSRCSSRLHTSSNCPYIWRVYIRSLNAPSPANAPKLRFACYNCASSEHFGDDCKFPRAHPIQFVDRTAFTIDENRPRAVLGQGMGSSKEGDYHHHRDKLPRPDIVNGIRQHSKPSLKMREELEMELEELGLPPELPKGPRAARIRARGNISLQQNDREDEEDDLEFASHFKQRLNGKASPKNSMPEVNKATKVNGRDNNGNRSLRQKWEPFSNQTREREKQRSRGRSRSRSRSAERRNDGREKHLRFANREREAERIRGNQGDSHRPSESIEPFYRNSIRQDHRQERKNEQRARVSGLRSRQLSPDFSRRSPELFDPIQQGRDEMMRAVASEDKAKRRIDGRARQGDNWRPPLPTTHVARGGRGGGKYRGGYV